MKNKISDLNIQNLNSKKRIFSAIQPSGSVTLGNYLGSLKNWQEMQENYDCIFAIADLHTLTIRQDPKLFNENILKTYTLFMACGINPEKSLFFIQSHVAAHSQLAWILNCYAFVGELSRMTQFKDKSKKYSENINAGLFTYPCLMAADILLYDTNFVPIGKDQKQHVEMTRDIAQRFNNLYGKTFVLPESIIPEIGSKIMSLKNPDKKMSKSDLNPESYIAILDEPKIIINKIQHAVTDSNSEIKYHKGELTGINNLITIYSCLTNKTLFEIEKEFEGKGYGHFKKIVSEIIISELEPIQKRFKDFNKNYDLIKSYYNKNSEAASLIAQEVLARVYEKIGLLAI
ncbi:MAG: tryptophan--tRNA ligase [Oscillospiraceae bacterium]|jgi:tryptophanyl-tRNA synthetase|nr:tryptophan--tRNA ligase [Oscillospiraceae bacterium]